MTQKEHALITQAVTLLGQIQGTETENKDIGDCIRRLNAVANISVIRNSMK